MKKTIHIIAVTIVFCLMLVGCGQNNTPPEVQNTLDKVEQMAPPVNVVPPQESPTEDTKENGYVTISAEDAKAIMDSDVEYIILDVRTQEEYNEGHIQNAVLLPVDNINESETGPVIGGKDKTILVYCRSGNRSKMASAKLAELGYSDVRNFGGIVDWPYEIIN